MKKLKGLPNFFNENFLPFSPIQPDSKLTALHRGLMDYYETYSICLANYNENYTSNFYEYFAKAPKEIFLNKASGHDFLLGYFSSITFIHLSFDQFIFEILENKSPMLAKHKLKKESALIKTYTEQNTNIDVSKNNYVNYSVGLSRVEKLIIKNDELPLELRLDSKYHFLKDHIKTLKQLSILRNDIIHSGKQMLNRYVYEFFFVNQLLPLIRQYLNIHEPSPYLERNLDCNKNVIDEISRFKLPEKFNNLSKYDNLCTNLRRINHFKELGRASFQNPINMLEWAVSDEHKIDIEKNQNTRKRNIANLYAKLKLEKLGHYEVHICPCCGTQSLTTFDRWTILENNKTRVQTAECVVCTYRVNVNIGEPKEFGIMNTELFTFVD